MAHARYVKTKIWDQDYFGDLAPHGKLVFLHAITNDKTNIAGCYQITVKKISDDTGVSRDEIREWLAKFEQDGKLIFRDGWLFMTSFIEHQVLNAKILKGIRNTLPTLPEWAIDRIRIAYPELFIGYAESTDSVSDNFKHTNTNSQSSTHNGERPSAGVCVPPVRVHVSDGERAFTDKIFDGLRERFGQLQLRHESEWLTEIEQAWAARVSSDDFLEVFDLLKKQKWRTGRITAKTVGDNLSNLDRLRLEIREQETNAPCERKDAAEAARSVGARPARII